MKRFYSSFLVVSLFVFSAFNQVSAQIPVCIFEAEPNNTSGTAQVLNLGAQNVTIVRGSIDPGGDVEFFRINGVVPGSKIWLVTDPGGTQVAGATSRDLVMDLLAADGTTVIENDDDDGTGNGGDGTIETGLASTIGGRILVTGGTYYISLRAFSATGIVNPYRLFVNVTPPGAGSPEVEANNTAATANVLATGPAVNIRTASIGVAGDEDYYSISLQAGNVLVISADADPARTGSGTDLVVEVRDPADVLLLSFDSGITGSIANPSCESANYTITASGTYFIKVRHFSAAGTGTYDLMAAAATGSALAATPLIISEFRVRGPSGANDEFVEVYNNSTSPYTVSASDGSLGYSVASSDAVVRFIIPNGTVIPAKGHYLGVNSVAYSLSGYPGGTGPTTGDATFTTDIPDNAGIALFRTSIPANFDLITRMDAVGSTSEANTLYKEGTGYPALVPFSIDYDFRRKTYTGPPQDTDNNASDFEFDDTNGTSAGAGQRLGTPGPENLSSPVSRDANIVVTRLDQTVGESSPPNMVRDFTSDPPNNSTFGTVDLRYRITNNTGAPITRLRLRIDSITTFPSPSGTSDLRPRTSGLVVVAGINDPVTCLTTGIPGTPPCTVNVEGTTLEQPPSQPNGGGYNSSLSVGAVTPGTPLANGASINVRLLFGVQQDGIYGVKFTPEILPGIGVGATPPPVLFGGCTLTCPANITQSNDPNQCGAVVNYPPPTTTGGCGTVTATPASGSFFPIGTTTVTVTSTAGPTCTFTITVNDTQPPTITCPSNIALCGSQAVSFTVTASDNCPGLTLVSVPASGSVFPVGITTVTSTATDAAGNTATCTFTVNILPIPSVNPVPNQTVCNTAPTAPVVFSGPVPGTVYNWINNTPSIGLAASGAGNIASFNAINLTNAPVTATITVTPVTSNTVTQTFNYTGAFQTFVVPAGVTTVSIQASGAQGMANAAGVSLGGLGGNASGNLAVTPGETLWVYVGGGGTTGATGGFNGGGNGGTTGTCLTALGGGGGGASDVRQTANTLANRRIVGGGGGGTAGNRVAACARGAGGGGGGGYYGGGGGSGYPGTAGVVPTGGTQVAGGIGGVTGTTFGATNGLPGVLGIGGAGGNEIFSNQAGNQAVIFGSGAGGGLTGNPGQQSGLNNFTGQSGAGGSSYIGGVTSGSTTPGVRSGNGLVTISYSVPGPICTGPSTSFTITVNPTPNAVATPPTQTICSGTAMTPIVLTGNVAGTVFNWTRNNTVNVTGIPNSGSGNISGTPVNITGVQQTVIFTITPVANGCTGASITATLIVNKEPTITCPANITVNNTPGQCGAIVTYPAATATGSPPPVITYSQASGTFFPVGTTTVTATATNICGVATCTFTITVLDVQPPTITCPAPITQNTDVGACVATVATPNPATADNCAVTAVTWVMTGATTGSSPATGINYVGTRPFNLNGTTGSGVTTITYTVRDAAGNTATCSFTVTVIDAWIPVIGGQPTNQTVCVGTNAVFTVTASVPAGNPLTYQWQAWNGTAWVNIAGATNATLPLNAVTFSMNTNSYRCILTGRCSVVTSGFATLYVNQLPTISLLASGPLALLPAQSVTLTAVVSPGGGTYQWFKNGVAIAGATGASLAGLTVDDIGAYRCRYTDLNGCIATSADMVVSGQTSDNLYVYPNPNNGHFHIRFYNQANEDATVRVFDMRGALVYQKKVVTTLPYTDIDMDLTSSRIISTETYLVEVRGSNGRLIGSKKIIIYK